MINVTSIQTNKLIPIFLITALGTLSGCGGGGGGDSGPSTPADTISPVITLSGGNTITVNHTEAFSDPGATARDAVDGTVSVTTTGNVDVSTVGNYTLTYTASDSSGNRSTITRIVNVVDVTPPTILINGESVVSLIANTQYNELSASASDIVDGNIDVVTSGTVDASTLGSYTVTYSASDSAGNQSTLVRTINVLPAMLGGTAAGGAGIVGTVTVKGAQGNEVSVAINDDGTYDIDVTSLVAPFKLRAEGTVGGKIQKLHSYAEAVVADQVTNITPFTDLIIANTASQSAETFFDSDIDTTLDATELVEQETVLQAKLQNVFDALNIDTNVDLMTTTFAANHSGLDAALDIIEIKTGDNNVAVIKNKLDDTTIVDDIMNTDDNDAVIEIEVGSVTTAVNETVAIAQLFTDFSDVFANSIPTEAALSPLFNADFVSNDMPLSDFLQEALLNDAMLGLKFYSLSVKDLDSNNPYVTFSVSINEQVIVESEKWFLFKDEVLGWQFLGDKHIVELEELNYRCYAYGSANAENDSERCGISVSFEDFDTSNNGTDGQAIQSATVAIIDGEDASIKDIIYLGTNASGSETAIYNESAEGYYGSFREFGLGNGQIDLNLFVVGDTIEYTLYAENLDLTNPALPATVGQPVVTYSSPINYIPQLTGIYPDVTDSNLDDFTWEQDIVINWSATESIQITAAVLEVFDNNGDFVFDYEIISDLSTGTVFSQAVLAEKLSSNSSFDYNDGFSLNAFIEAENNKTRQVYTTSYYVDQSITSEPVASEFASMQPFENSGAVVDGNTFVVPADALDYAGFANDNTTLYPFNFANGGTVTFTASVPANAAGMVTNTTVRFKFENAPYPDVNPSFDAGSVVVDSAIATTYTIDIPAQDAANSYRSLLMYVDTRDAPVTVTNIVVTENDENVSGGGNAGGATPPGNSGSEFASMQPFENSGAVVDGSTFMVPAVALDYAGFANDNTTLYPFNFANGGTVTFTASVPANAAGMVTNTTVRFKFENAPYPDVNPSFDAGSVVVDSAIATTYTIDIPAQDAANSYRSLLMYVDTRDAPVTVTNIVVTENDENVSGGGNAGGATPPGNGGGSTPLSWNVNGYALTQSSDFAPLASPPPGDLVLGGGDSIELTLLDPEGFIGDTHGTRILASLRLEDPNNSINVSTQSTGEYYYDVTGTGGVTGNEITLSSLKASIVEHYIRQDGALGIISRSYDNSPSLWQNTLGQWELVNGDYYHSEAVIIGNMIAGGNSLHVSSMENKTVTAAGIEIPNICENNLALSSNDPIPVTISDEQNNLLGYIPPCGAIDHYLAEQDVSMDNTLFVGVAEYAAFAIDGIVANHIVLLDMDAYFPEDLGNQRKTTSHATPIVAAKAAQLATAEDITDASVLKLRLLDFVDPVTRLIDLNAIDVALGLVQPPAASRLVTLANQKHDGNVLTEANFTTEQLNQTSFPMDLTITYFNPGDPAIELVDSTSEVFGAGVAKVGIAEESFSTGHGASIMEPLRTGQVSVNAEFVQYAFLGEYLPFILFSESVNGTDYSQYSSAYKFVQEEGEGHVISTSSFSGEDQTLALAYLNWLATVNTIQVSGIANEGQVCLEGETNDVGDCPTYQFCEEAWEANLTACTDLPSVQVEQQLGIIAIPLYSGEHVFAGKRGSALRDSYNNVVAVPGMTSCSASAPVIAARLAEFRLTAPNATVSDFLAAETEFRSIAHSLQPDIMQQIRVLKDID